MNGKGLIAVGVPVLPFWLLIVRGAAIVLSLGVLIASAYYLSINRDFGGYVAPIVSGPPGFLIFDVIFTWGILGTMIAFEFFLQKFYYRIVFFVLLILDVIFWLAAWAWSAERAAWYFGGSTVYSSVWRKRDVVDDILSDYDFGDLGDLTNGSPYSPDYSTNKWGVSLAAATALGALTWVLVIVTTVFFGIACLREPDNETTVNMQGSELEQAQKQGGTEFVQPVPAGSPPPQQQYPPQQYPQQPVQQQY
jgi:hypothetical protein